MSTDIIAAHPNEKISTVKELMEDNCVHHLPVVSGKKLLGIVSAIDLLRISFSDVFTHDNKANNILDHTATLEDIMTKNVFTIKDTDNIRHAAEMLADCEFNSLMVVNETGELVGVVTSVDLINYLLAQY